MRKHNGHGEKEEGELTAEEFAEMTIGQLYDMVEQAQEPLFTLCLNGADGRPFAMFCIALGSPEQLERYGKAIEAVRPTVVDAVEGALNG